MSPGYTTRGRCCGAFSARRDRGVEERRLGISSMAQSSRRSECCAELGRRAPEGGLQSPGTIYRRQRSRASARPHAWRRGPRGRALLLVRIKRGSYSAASRSAALASRPPDQEVGVHHVAEDRVERRQRRIVLLVGARRVGVADHDGLEIEHHGVTRRRLAADIRDRAGDQHRVVALRAQPLRQIGRALDEGTETIFLHDLVLGLHVEA